MGIARQLLLIRLFQQSSKNIRGAADVPKLTPRHCGRLKQPDKQKRAKRRMNVNGRESDYIASMGKPDLFQRVLKFEELYSKSCFEDPFPF